MRRTKNSPVSFDVRGSAGQLDVFPVFPGRNIMMPRDNAGYIAFLGHV